MFGCVMVPVSWSGSWTFVSGCCAGFELGSDLCGCFSGATPLTCPGTIGPGCDCAAGLVNGKCCATCWMTAGLMPSMSIALGVTAVAIGSLATVTSESGFRPVFFK